MTVRTVKHGFISREASLARMRGLFAEIEMEAVIQLFTGTKSGICGAAILRQANR
jgi:hypothetical protein